MHFKPLVFIRNAGFKLNVLEKIKKSEVNKTLKFFNDDIQIQGTIKNEALPN